MIVEWKQASFYNWLLCFLSHPVLHAHSEQLGWMGCGLSVAGTGRQLGSTVIRGSRLLLSCRSPPRPCPSLCDGSRRKAVEGQQCSSEVVMWTLHTAHLLRVTGEHLGGRGPPPVAKEAGKCGLCLGSQGEDRGPVIKEGRGK